MGTWEEADPHESKGRLHFPGAIRGAKRGNPDSATSAQTQQQYVNSGSTKSSEQKMPIRKASLRR